MLKTLFFLTLHSICDVYGQVETTAWDDDMLDTTEPPNCGSLYVSVEVTEPPSFSGTKVSASVYFPPYSYSLVGKNVVELDDGDNICDDTSISGDYDGKILLLEVDETECSSQYQVYIAQISGAKAVIFYNNQDGNEVYHLSADQTAPITTIPARMVSQNDGYEFITAIEEAGTLTIELNCEYGDYAQSFVF